MRIILRPAAVILTTGLISGCSSGSEPVADGTFVRVAPLARTPAPAADVKAAPATAELRIQRSRFFSFAMPSDWRVAEDGQFALTLTAPDSRALTVMVGNAGLPPQYPPARYAYEKLMALQPQNLQLGAPRQAPPAGGFDAAVVMDVSYVVSGAACRGVAKVSIAPAYDTQTMAMTAALSASDQWDGYATWLPQVAEQIAATDGAAFGRRGLMQQNLANSTAYAAAARDYRAWSARQWQSVTDQRNASVDRRAAEFRDNLGGVQTYTNPFPGVPAYELPTTYKHYWTDPQGNIVGTNNPTADPNAGSTVEWRRMPVVAR